MSQFDIADGSGDDQAEIRRKRLLFRCWHRGTQEIDLIFGSFAESSAGGLSPEQLDRFEARWIATTPICSIGSPVTASHRRYTTMT